MTTENFLLFFFKNNAVLIEVLVVMILLFAAFLTFRSFKVSKDEELGVSPAGEIGPLEEMMKKLLEKANALPMAGTVTQSATAAGSGGEAKGIEAKSIEAKALLEQITTLKKQLESKQGEIESIKAVAPAGATAAAPAAGMSKEDKTAMENQIKELQRKLEEFDIISADIADLSFYKEENQRLQKELGATKTGAPTPVAAPPIPPIPPTPSAAPASVGAAPVTEPAKVEGSVQEVVDEDLIKEYAAMVDAQRAGEPAQPVPVKAVPLVPEESSVQSQSVPGMPDIDIPAIGENIAPSPAAEIDLGNLDLDKMVAEAGNLSESVAVPTEDILNQSTDAEKLAKEAEKMTVDPQTKEVIGQFEDFAKKEK